MRAPPAVSIDARPGAGWRLFQTLLHTAAAAAAAHWAASSLAWHTILPTATAAAVAAVAGWRGSAAVDARLSWTGAQWQLGRVGREPVAVQAPQVMIDFGGWLLLRLQPIAGGARQWLAVTRSGAPGEWHLLRAAVYSAAPEPKPRSTEERPPF